MEYWKGHGRVQQNIMGCKGSTRQGSESFRNAWWMPLWQKRLGVYSVNTWALVCVGQTYLEGKFLYEKKKAGNWCY